MYDGLGQVFQQKVYFKSFMWQVSRTKIVHGRWVSFEMGSFLVLNGISASAKEETTY